MCVCVCVFFFFFFWGGGGLFFYIKGGIRVTVLIHFKPRPHPIFVHRLSNLWYSGYSKCQWAKTRPVARYLINVSDQLLCHLLQSARKCELIICITGCLLAWRLHHQPCNSYNINIHRLSICIMIFYGNNFVIMREFLFLYFYLSQTIQKVVDNGNSKISFSFKFQTYNPT